MSQETLTYMKPDHFMAQALHSLCSDSWAQTKPLNPKHIQRGIARAQGSPAYMAPELFAAGAPHSSASDLWALGCVMYECFAGRPPFEDTSLQKLSHSILLSQPAPLQG